MEGRTTIRRKTMNTITDKQINEIVKYYESFASYKQKTVISELLSKEAHSHKDIDKLKRFAFKYRMFIESNSMNVNSRLKKIQDSPYKTYVSQGKEKITKQYFNKQR